EGGPRGTARTPPESKARAGKIDGAPFHLGKALVAQMDVIVFAEGADVTCQTFADSNLSAKLPPMPEGRSIVVGYPHHTGAGESIRFIYFTRSGKQEREVDTASVVTVEIKRLDSKPGGHVVGAITGQGSGDLSYELSGVFDAEICPKLIPAR